ncbi:hypothetical protein AB9K32_00355 [Allomuricauda sp. XS_ASV26]|uniref:hypothetical protein n=1 Tax=Allomuricauda sp. XS_ASV26 TaxID=3241292 RepID=UPI0035165903
MKESKIPILLFIIIFFISCSEGNSDNTTNEDGETKNYLIEISSNISLITEENSFDFADYNNSFSRHQNGNIDSWEIDFIGQTTKFEFENESGNITKLTTTDFDVETQSTSIEETTVTYDGENRIIKIESYANGVKYQDYEIVHNGSDVDFIDLLDNRNREITIDENNNLKTFYQESIDFSMVFEYSNGNLIKKTLNQTNILSYVHDDKINPFNKEFFLNFSTLINYLNVIGGWEFLFYDENNIFGNKNNILEFMVENNEFGGLQNHSFVYEYSSGNMPLKKSSENNSIEANYIYVNE